MMRDHGKLLSTTKFPDWIEAHAHLERIGLKQDGASNYFQSRKKLAYATDKGQVFVWERTD